MAELTAGRCSRFKKVRARLRASRLRGPLLMSEIPAIRGRGPPRRSSYHRDPG
jgi:hypothetical protein